MKRINKQPPNAVPQPSSRVKGLDLGDLVVAFAREKLVVSTKKDRGHFTVHFGPISQTLDVHRTDTADDGSSIHKTLFSISHAGLASLMQELAPSVYEAVRDLFRPLRSAWMKRKRVVAVVGLLPSEADIPGVTKRRHRKLALDPEKLRAHVRILKAPAALGNLRDGERFTLFSRDHSGALRPIGFGVRLSDHGHHHLFWARGRDIDKARARLEPMLLALARKHGRFHRPLPCDSSGTEEDGRCR